jgi:hypothetical protein
VLTGAWRDAHFDKLLSMKIIAFLEKGFVIHTRITCMRMFIKILINGNDVNSQRRV